MKFFIKYIIIISIAFCVISFCSQNAYSQCSVLYMSSVTTGAGAGDQCDPADPLHEQFTICYEVCPNCGVVPDIDIGGMQIFDNTGTASIRYTFPAGTMLAPGGCVTVEAGDAGMACPVWNNGGDCLLMMGAPADVDVVLSVLYGGTSDPDCTGAPNTINGSDAGGGVFTLSAADALDCTQCVTDPPTGTPTITEASCGANCTQVDGSIAIGSLACPGGSGNIQYSTDGGTTWSATLPTYDQTTAVSFTASCSCDDTQTIGPFTTAPQSCPTVAAPTGGSITDSTCPAGDPAPTGGAIVDPTCATGTLNWSETAGGPYNTTTPTYNQAGPAQTFYAVCIDANGCESPEFTLGTTTPGECAAACDPAILAATPAITVDSESTCAMAGGTLMGGAISAATCPTGSTVEYSTDGGASWSTTLPTYDQDNSISVMARCVCDIDMTMIGTGMAVATTPGTCPPPTEACNACDCASANAPADSYTINTVADNGSQAGYTLTYTLTGNGDPLETDTPAAATPASFPGLADNTPYDVCAFNVLDADLAAFQAALANEAAVADAMAGTGAFMALCYTQVCMNFPAEDCQCVTCPDLTAVGSEAPPVNIDSEAGCDTSTTPFTTIVGVTSDVTATCPAGSTLEYSYDMGATWVATFMDTYDQSTAVEIRTRCVCDSDNTVIGPETIVVTNPQEGCPPEVCPACDCSAASGDYYTINTVAIGQTGYTLIYVLVDNDTGDVVLQNNQTGMFTAVADNINYTVYAYNVLDADVAAFTGAIPTNLSMVNDAAFATYCYEGASMPFFQDCDCCPDISATLTGEGQICTSSDAVDISVGIVGGTAPYTVVYSDGTTNTTVTAYNSNDAITLSPTSTTPGATVFTYTLVSVQDANGCTSTVDGTGTITVLMSCANAGSINGSGN